MFEELLLQAKSHTVFDCFGYINDVSDSFKRNEFPHIRSKKKYFQCVIENFIWTVLTSQRKIRCSHSRSFPLVIMIFKWQNDVYNNAIKRLGEKLNRKRNKIHNNGRNINERIVFYLLLITEIFFDWARIPLNLVIFFVYVWWLCMLHSS